MLYGNLKDGIVTLVTDPKKGKVIVENDPPEMVPDGFKAVYDFLEDKDAIGQAWTIVADPTSVMATITKLAAIQAKNLSDQEAIEVITLFDKWDYDNHKYSVGDRVRFDSSLYKCILEHTSSNEFAPDLSPNIWTKIVKGIKE